MFDKLVAEDAARKAFFANISAQSKTLSQAELQQALIASKGKGSSSNRLYMEASIRLENFGLTAFSQWADEQNTVMASKPVLHK